MSTIADIYDNDIIWDEQEHEEALSRAQEMKSKQEDAETATLGRIFTRDADQANAFSKLSRYETGMWQSLYKALHELQRLQPPATPRATSHRPRP